MLVLVGVLVIGLIDNVLRPILVGRDTRLPGLRGAGLDARRHLDLRDQRLRIGPLIAALFIAAWTLFRDEQAEQRRVERAAQAAAKR